MIYNIKRVLDGSGTRYSCTVLYGQSFITSKQCVMANAREDA